MKPPPFHYAAPTTLAEAVGLLAEHADDEPRVLAGGQSLIPLMNFRLANPGHLIDLRRVAGLTASASRATCWSSAPWPARPAAERVARGRRWPRRCWPRRSATSRTRPVRNRGTVGGSLAHADPAAELPAVVLALDAELVAAGPAGRRAHRGRRVLPRPVQHGAGSPDEILTEIRLPRRGRRARVRRVRPDPRQLRRGRRWPRSSSWTATGSRRAAIALSGVAPTAVRATAAERVLAGAAPDAAAVARGRRRRGRRASPRPATCTAAPQTRIAIARTYLRRGDRAGRCPAHGTEVSTVARIDQHDITLTVNGRTHDRRGRAAPAPGRLPARGPRARGTHIGCEHGVCGTCTVLRRRRAASGPASCSPCRPTAPRSARSRAWPTAREMHPLQDEFWDKQGLQCGYCTPGMLMRACEILEREPRPDARAGRASRSRATSAAAPATSSSSRPCVAAAARMRASPTGGALTTVDRAAAGPAGPHPQGQAASGSASRSAASRTRSSCAAAAATSATWITPGMLHAAVLRSPHAHARITAIDTAAAEAAPGVHAVITGARGGRAVRPAARLRPRTPPRTPGAAWRWTRCATSARASRSSSRTAATSPRTRSRLIDVEYEPLPAVVDPERGAGRGRPAGARGAGVQLRLRAHLRLRRRRRRLRRAPTSIVTRPAALAPLGRPAAGDRRRHRRLRPGHRRASPSHTNSLSFTSYLFMVAGTLKIPVNKLDIRPVPAGGSFGSKLFATKPAVIAGMCSREVGRPVQYLEDRVDNISNCDHHGSDRVYDVELAVMRDGTMRGIDIDTVDDYGAYIQFGVGPPRQRAGPGRRPVHDRQRAVPGAGGADQQEPAGRLPGLRLRGEQLDARADGRQGRAGARRRPGARSAGATSSASSRTSSRPATSTTPATTTRCWTRRWSSADYDHWRGRAEAAPARRAATSASG